MIDDSPIGKIDLSNIQYCTTFRKGKAFMSIARLKVNILCLVLVTILLSVGTTQAQLAEGATKFLGNITTNGRVRSDFGTYWNQITGENEHKWISVEGERDKMNWRGADAIANYARQNNIPWKFHTLVWGSQYPTWMDRLSTTEQIAEITEWYDSAAVRYPDVQMIDVVNEAYMSNPNDWNAGKHAPVPFRNALGGTGTTGFDWIVTSFKMARERWPKAVLIYNDFNTLEWNAEISWIKQIIPKLVAAGAPIDAVGFQAHGLKGTSAATLKSRLDDIYNAIKLPMFITEYDIGETNDQAQLDNYKAHIPVMWNHPKIAGITIWGYMYDSTWVKGTGLIRNGQDRPAMTWLKDYIKNNLTPPNDYPDLLKGNFNYSLSVSTKGRGSVSVDPNESSYEKDTKVTLTATPSEDWVFSGWSGGVSGNQNPLTVTMSKTIKITANFTTKDGKEDLVLNGSFSAGSESWAFNNWSGTGTGSAVNGEYKLTVSSVAENYYDIQVVQPGIKLEKGKTYRVIYDAYASAERVLNVNVGMPVEPYSTFLKNIIAGKSELTLTTSKKTYSFDFTMEEETYDNSRIEFSVGTNTPAVIIDNVSLFEVEPVVVSSPVSQKAKKEINIRQNESVVSVTLNATEDNRAFVDIYDLNGALVRSTSFKVLGRSTHNFSLGTADMPRGYYILKVRCGNLVKKSGLVITGR